MQVFFTFTDLLKYFFNIHDNTPYFCRIFSDIIEHVKATEFPPYRPVIPDLIEKVEELREMAKECWNDIPHERPTFSELKKRVHRLLANLKM